MNRERMQTLADTVRNLQHTAEAFKGRHVPHAYVSVLMAHETRNPLRSFCMKNWIGHSKCGTAGCLAGVAAMLWPPDNRHCVSVLPYAIEVLGLSLDDSGLFTPGVFVPYEDISPEQAAAAVENVLGGMDSDAAWRQAVTAHPDRLGNVWRYEGPNLVCESAG